MKKYATTIGASSLWFSAALNAGFTLLSLWRHDFAAAALQSILVAFLAAWLAVKPKYYAWVDARLAQAIAQQAAAEVVLEELRRLHHAGELQLGVTMAGPIARTH